MQLVTRRLVTSALPVGKRGLHKDHRSFIGKVKDLLLHDQEWNRSGPPYCHAVQIGDPVLRGKAIKVDFDIVPRTDIEKAAKCIVKVIDTYKLVGLAAPQIGLPWQMFAVRVTKEQVDAMEPELVVKHKIEPVPLTILVNPNLRVISSENQMVEAQEGCASMMGFSCPVLRHREVEVTGHNVDGSKVAPWRVRDMTARILQHEYDHLHGTMFVDRMTSSQKLRFDYWSAINQKGGNFKLSYIHNAVQNLKRNRKFRLFRYKDRDS